MSKGENVHSWVRKLVLETAAENLDLTAREFMERLAPVIADKGFPVPGVDWFRKRMREVRNVLDDSDGPWSLGVLSSTVPPRITEEALPDVCAVWKVCLYSGQPFTIRQARWVARLRQLVPEHEVGPGHAVELHRWASIYAGAEIAHRAEAAKSLKNSSRSDALDTRDMDAALLLSGAVNDALVVTAVVERFINRRQLLIETAPQLEREHAAINDLMKRAPDERDRLLEECAEFIRDHRSIIIDASSSGRAAEKDPDGRGRKDAETVWSIWVRSMTVDGTRWWELTDERRTEIKLETLRQTMTHYVESMDRALDDLDDPWPKPFKPSAEILCEVGHPVNGG